MTAAKAMARDTCGQERTHNPVECGRVNYDWIKRKR